MTSCFFSLFMTSILFNYAYGFLARNQSARHYAAGNISCWADRGIAERSAASLRGRRITRPKDAILWPVFVKNQLIGGRGTKQVTCPASSNCTWQALVRRSSMRLRARCRRDLAPDSESPATRANSSCFMPCKSQSMIAFRSFSSNSDKTRGMHADKLSIVAGSSSLIAKSSGNST